MRGMTVLLALIAGAACLSSVSQGAPAAPEQLRCEGLANPLGIDRAQPRFSWAIPPGVRGLAQTARQVLVADSPDALAADRGTLWDSGKVESNQSQWVPYAGAPLAKGSRCWWKVRVWDQTGAPSPWSEPASFTVGPLSAADWSGEWIGADWMKNNEGPLPWLRKTVTLEKVPTTATAYVCALGYYELYVNGQKVGDDVLSPAVSDYGKRGLYLTHDITKHLVKGKNCIGLWLGRGWSLGVLKNAGIVGPMVKAELNLTFDGAAPLTIVTDATWKARPSHITPLGKGTSGSYGGELVEAEKEIANWSAADYDDSGWQAAAVHHPPTPVIAAQMMEPNRMLDEVHLAAVQPLDGGFLLDMGRNYTGWFELALPDDVKRGTTITMEFADKQLANGKFQTYGQRSVYVARGGGGERFRNRFNYAAFRYAIGEGPAAGPEAGRGQGLAGHHQLRARLDLLLRQPAAQPDPRHDVLDLQVPQPGRLHRRLPAPGAAGLRRRLGDLDGNGDAQLPHRAVLRQVGGRLARRPERSGRRALHRALLAGRRRRPGLERLLHHHALADLPHVRRPAAARTGLARHEEVAGVHRHEDGRRPAAVATWASAAPARPSGTSSATGCRREESRARTASTTVPPSSSTTATWCTACSWPARSAASWATTPRPRSTQTRAKELAARLHARFLNPDGATYANGEQTYLVMPLLFGITPPNVAPQVMAALEHDITVTRNGHLNTGMHGNYFMAKYLIEQRRNDLLALMHTKEDFPSFGHMIRNGATTIWEEWDGDNSQIHNTMISVGLWFIEGLAGIRYDEQAPGFQHFIAAPGVESGLKRVEASLTTGYGKITSAWRVEGDTLTWELAVPPNTTATVVIPATGLDAVRESGLPVETQPGIAHPAVEKGLFRCDVASGTYRFTSRLP